MMCILLLNSYKATLKSYLTVKDLSLDINSMQDVLESPKDVILTKYDYTTASQLSGFPKTSPEYQVYTTKLKGLGMFVEDWETEEDFVTEMRDGNVMFMGALAKYLKDPYYPCDIVDVKPLR